VFGITDDTDIEDIGQVRWQLTLCNLLGWVIIYLCIVKGIQASGKVTMFFVYIFEHCIPLFRDECHDIGGRIGNPLKFESGRTKFGPRMRQTSMKVTGVIKLKRWGNGYASAPCPWSPVV